MSQTERDVTTRQATSVGIGVALSVLGSLIHNGREFGLEGLLALETATIPIVFIETTLFILY